MLGKKLGLLMAAAVFAAITGTIIAIQGTQRGKGPSAGEGASPQGSKPTAKASCGQVMAPTSWLRAIDAGAIPVDRPLNRVVSVNGGTGDYLANQGDEPASWGSQLYSDLEVALFRGSRGETIYTPAGNDVPWINPTGAISADWVTFAITRPQSLNYSYQVLLYDRGTGVTRTLAEGDQQNSQGKRLRKAPVIAAGKVYWLASPSDKPETTTLESWDLAGNSAAGSVPAAGATGLVSYGSGVALIHLDLRYLTNGAGAPLAQAQLDAARGVHFGFDGVNKLSWLRTEDRTAGYSSLVVGGTSVSHLPLNREVAAAGIPQPLYPFVATAVNAVLDLRTDTIVVLPQGVGLPAVVGDEVIFETGISQVGAAGLSRVALSALPPVSC
jgi:hypothetical protein